MESDLDAGAGIAAFMVCLMILNALVDEGLLPPATADKILIDSLEHVIAHAQEIPARFRDEWAAARILLEQTQPRRSRTRRRRP